ncbi:MAG: hypothetical protein OHK0038_06270 [Flammeovirgaceae bacterium]
MENVEITQEKPLKKNNSFFSFFINRLKKIKRFSFNLSLQSLENKASLLVSLMLKIGIIVLSIVFGIILYKEVNNLNYTITHIHVPKVFEARGYNSSVIASKLMDEVRKIKQWGKTQKNTNDLSGSIDKSLMDVQIMGVGFSMSALIYHTKKLVGIKPREIAGELILKDSSLALTLRMTGTDIFYIEKTFSQSNDKYKILDSLMMRAGEKIMEVVEPYQLAVYYHNLGDDESALKQIRYIINHLPEEKKWAYNLWGNIFRTHSGDTLNLKKAIVKYKIAQELDANYVMPLYNLGLTYLDLNNLDEAIYQLEKAIQIDPNYTIALHQLAKCYLHKKDTIKAKEIFETLKNKTLNKEEEGLLSDLIIQFNDTSSILKLYQKKEEEGKILSAQEYKYLSFLLGNQNRHVEAIEKLSEGIDFYPQDFDMRINLILRYALQGDKEKAIYEADKLIKIDAPIRLGYLFKGYVYAIFEDIPNAKDMLEISSKDVKIKPFNLYLETVIAYYEKDMETFYLKLEEHLKYNTNFDGLTNLPPVSKLKTDERLRNLLKKYGKDFE